MADFILSDRLCLNKSTFCFMVAMNGRKSLFVNYNAYCTLCLRIKCIEMLIEEMTLKNCDKQIIEYNKVVHVYIF